MTVAGLVSSIIVTRNLGAELKGEYNGLLLITSFYAPMLLFGYTNGVLYYGIRKIIDVRKYFWTGLLIVTLASLPIIILVYVLMQNGLLGSILENVPKSIKLLLFYVTPFVLLNVYCERVFKTFHLFLASNKRLIISTILMLVYYIVYFLITKTITLEVAMIGLIINQVSQFIFNLQFIYRHIKVENKLQKDQLFLPWKYGIQVWMNQIIAKSNDKFDQLILSFLMIASQFGLYVVGVSYSNLVTKLPESYIQVFYNKVVGKELEFQIQIFKVLQRFTMLVSLIIGIVLTVLSIYLIPLMYGTGYSESIIVVAFYLPGVVFQIIGRLNIKFYAALGKPLKNSLVYVVGLVVSLPFYFLLVPMYGIAGAAISSSIAYLAAYAFSFWQISRDYKVNWFDTIIFRRSDIAFWKTQLAQLRKK